MTDVMTKVFFALIVLFSSVSLYSGVLLRNTIHACGTDALARLNEAKVRVAKTGEIRPYCTQSYTVLSEWDECVKNVSYTNTAMPNIFVLGVHWVLRITGERGVDLDVLKHEHDLQCSKETDLMFFPPEFL